MSVEPISTAWADAQNAAAASQAACQRKDPTGKAAPCYGGGGWDVRDEWADDYWAGPACPACAPIFERYRQALAANRAANRAAGLCRCGNAPAPGVAPGTGRPYRRCPACLERRRATRQSQRRTNVAAGLCPCGNAPAPSIAPSDDQPYRHCPECLGRFSATRRAQAAS